MTKSSILRVAEINNCETIYLRAGERVFAFFINMYSKHLIIFFSLLTFYNVYLTIWVDVSLFILKDSFFNSNKVEFQHG